MKHWALLKFKPCMTNQWHPTLDEWVGRGGFVVADEIWANVVEECYRRAAEARRIADSAPDPVTRAEFLKVEQRWLSLALGHGAEEPC